MEDGALREAEEEAGVKGIATKTLGDLQNTESMTRTRMFALRVDKMLDVWKEGREDVQTTFGGDDTTGDRMDERSYASPKSRDVRGRRRVWFPVKEALGLLVSKVWV